LPPGEHGADNFAFAMHLTSFLAHGNTNGKSRDHCLFWENDGYRHDFENVPLTASPPEIRPSWAMVQRAIAESVDKKINELQEKDFPTRNLLQAVAENETALTPQERREKAGRRVVSILAAFTAIGAIVW